MDKEERRQRIAEATRLYDSGRYADAATAFSALVGEFTDDEKASEEFAWFSSNFGSALAESGNLKLAQSMMKAAIPAYAALGQTTELARTYLNLGNVYQYMNSLQRMVDSYQAALDVSRKAGNRDIEAHALLALYRAMNSIGATEQADEWLGQLAPLQDVIDGDPLLSWSMRFQQAVAALGKGDPAAALDRLHEALACLDGVPDVSYRQETESAIIHVKRQLGVDATEAELDSAVASIPAAGHGSRAVSELFALARLYRDRGDLAKAEKLFADCLAAIDRVRGGLDYGERFQWMEATARVAHEYSATLLARGRGEQALEVSERGQGRSLLDLMFRHQIKRQGGRSVRAADNGRVILDSPDIEEIRAFCRDLDVHVLKILIGGEGRSVAWFVDPSGQVEGWDATGALTALNELLAQSIWASFGGEAPATKNDAQLAPAPDKALAAQPPPWEDIEGLVVGLYEALLPEHVRATLESTSGRLLVVPHREYFFLPWSALGPSGAPLGERWDIGVTPSLGIAMQLDRRRDVRAWAGLESFTVPAVALGHVGEQDVKVPMLPRDLKDGGGEVVHFSDLPWTLGEARKVAQVMGGGIFTGADATPEALNAALGAAGIVHIASHGYWHPIPDMSFVLLSPGPASGTPTLFQNQVIDLMTQAELVALSGCQTGLGLPHPDTYLTLANSFLVAGARCVLVSLWPVRDDATLSFAESFYRHLHDGASPAGALRAVQAEFGGMLSPWDYAGFVAIGNPFFPMAAGEHAQLASGPAFCGGDLLWVGATAGQLMDLAAFSGKVQDRDEGWLLDGSDIKVLRKQFRPRGDQETVTP